jgi:hypothetical protein
LRDGVAFGRKNLALRRPHEAAKKRARLWSPSPAPNATPYAPKRYLTSILAKINHTQVDDLV